MEKCGGIFPAQNFSGQKFSRTKSPPPLCLTTPGVGRPGDGLLPVPLTRCIQVRVNQVHTDAPSESMRGFADSGTDLCALGGGGRSSFHLFPFKAPPISVLSCGPLSRAEVKGGMLTTVAWENRG